MPLASTIIQAPSGGIDSDSAPAYVQPTRAPLLRNLLPGRTGRVPLRGGANTHATNTATITTAANTGPWTFDDTILLPTSGSNLGTTVSPLNFTYTSFGSVVVGTMVTILPSYSRIGGFVFGPAIYNAASPSNISVLARWDGSSNLITYTNAPRGIVAVETHLNRLWALCSNSTGSTVANTLRWSDDGGPVTDTTAVWQDDASGLDNKIVFPDDGESGVALALLGRNLLIFRSRSIWLLSGTSPDTFEVRRVAAVGCKAASSIVEAGDTVYFSDADSGGFYSYDGATLRRLSDPVKNTLAFGMAFNWASRIDDEFLIVGTARNPSGVSSSDRTFLYHIRSGSWSEFTSASMTALPVWFGHTVSYAFALEGAPNGVNPVTARVWDMTAVGKPVGTTAAGNAPGFDVKGTSGSIIPARMTSRAIKLASPEEAAQLRSFMADYDLSTNGSGAAASGTAWNITATDDLGNTLFTASLAASDNPGRLRRVLDAYGEVSGAMQVDAQLVQTGTVRILSTAELEDLTVTYQPTRQRTG